MHNGGVSDSSTTPASPSEGAVAEGAVGLSKAARYGSVGAVWVLALVFAALIAAVSTPDLYASWLSLALAGCVLLGLVAQLSTQQKNGFVNRLAATVTGSFVILGAVGAILGIIAATR